MESARPFVVGRGVETDGSDTGAGSPCFVWNVLVTGYKDTVFLPSVQGEFVTKIFTAWFYRWYFRRSLTEKICKESRYACVEPGGSGISERQSSARSTRTVGSFPILAVTYA
jgi:hypothetical protein